VRQSGVPIIINADGARRRLHGVVGLLDQQAPVLTATSSSPGCVRAHSQPSWRFLPVSNHAPITAPFHDACFPTLSGSAFQSDGTTFSELPQRVL
jgi:hypothetical protein